MSSFASHDLREGVDGVRREAPAELEGSLAGVVAVGDREVGEVLKVLRAPGGALHRAQLLERADANLQALELDVSASAASVG